MLRAVTCIYRRVECACCVWQRRPCAVWRSSVAVHAQTQQPSLRRPQQLQHSLGTRLLSAQPRLCTDTLRKYHTDTAHQSNVYIGCWPVLTTNRRNERTNSYSIKGKWYWEKEVGRAGIESVTFCTTQVRRWLSNQLNHELALAKLSSRSCIHSFFNKNRKKKKQNVILLIVY